MSKAKPTKSSQLYFEFQIFYSLFVIYRIGTLLFGPSSELLNRNASGQLIQDADGGALLSIQYQNNIYSYIREFVHQL